MGLRSLFLVLAGIWGSAAEAQPGPNSQVGTSMAPATAAGVENASSNEKPLGGGAWQATTIFSNITVGLILADGRGDKTTRLYATDITTNTVKEFSFDGSWANTSNISLPFYAEGALLVGDGRADGSAHVYVGEFSSAGNVSEFTWDGTAWSGIAMGTAGQQMVAAQWCDPRSDGLLHQYFSTGGPAANNISYEFTYDKTGWMMDPIASPLTDASWGGFGLAVGPGRNDDVHRLYQGIFDAATEQNYIYELSWNGSDWDALELAEFGSGRLSQVMWLTVGQPRNDGLYRLYAVVRGRGVHEFTYDGTAWSETDLLPIGGEVFTSVVGQGRNDGVNRLYVGQLIPWQLFEATYDGKRWQYEYLGFPDGGVFRVLVGDGRGDGVNRVYSSGAAGVIEFTRQSL